VERRECQEERREQRDRPRPEPAGDGEEGQDGEHAEDGGGESRAPLGVLAREEEVRDEKGERRLIEHRPGVRAVVPYDLAHRLRGDLRLPDLVDPEVLRAEAVEPEPEREDQHEEDRGWSAGHGAGP